MGTLCHYRPYYSKRIEKYVEAVENGTLEDYHNDRGKITLSKYLELIKDYLYNKYKYRGHNFAFRSSTICRDTGMCPSVIGKALNKMFSPDYKGEVFAEVIHKTKYNKRTVWKTCFEG